MEPCLTINFNVVVSVIVVVVGVMIVYSCQTSVITVGILNVNVLNNLYEKFSSFWGNYQLFILVSTSHSLKEILVLLRKLHC